MENLIVPYVKALKTEIEIYLPEERLVRSIYFGGGTPSYLSVNLLAELLNFIKERFRLSLDIEITVEINPGTIKGPELLLLKSIGFNRLSIGLQAFQDILLKSIGRIHSWVDFLNVFEAGRTAGFDNLGIDIIFGLPGQNLQDWKETLERVTSLKPEHISAYGLQLEPGTKLATAVEHGLVDLPTDDEVADMMSMAMGYLPEKGYQQYEISNYARSGFQSVHNLSYWRSNDYLGFGAGAYSTINNERWVNIDEPWNYIDAVNRNGSIIKEKEKLDFKTRAIEALMLGLRLREGINLLEYKTEYGIDLTISPHINELLDQKLLVINGPYLALTDTGIMLSNSVISSLLVDI